MIPYLDLPPVRLGSWEIHPFTILVVIAVVTGHFHWIARARRSGVPHEMAAGCSLAAIVAGFAGSHLLKLLYTPTILLRGWGALDPFDGMSSFGGLAGGLAGMAVYFRALRVDPVTRGHLRDAAAFAFPFSWIFGRAGCVLGHDHPGIASASPLAVAYPGGPRHDLGLLELLFFLVVMIPLFLWLDRVRRPAGLYPGLLLSIQGAFRILLDQLHEDPPRYLGIAMDQWAGAASVLAGLWFLRRARLAED